MIIFKIKNEKGEQFEKEFDSPFIARNFYLKCKYSKRVRIISVSCDTSEEYNAVTY